VNSRAPGARKPARQAHTLGPILATVSTQTPPHEAAPPTRQVDQFDPQPAAQPSRCDISERAPPPPVTARLHRTKLNRQPRTPTIPISLSRRSSPERIPDQRPVILTRARRPRVAIKLGGVDPDETRQIDHRSARHFRRVTRKPGHDLIKLQQHSKPEPSSSRLVRHKIPISPDQSPRLDQLLRRPLLLHSADASNHPKRGADEQQIRLLRGSARRTTARISPSFSTITLAELRQPRGDPGHFPPPAQACKTERA